MRIHEIEIKNFRLLKNVKLLLEQQTTVIVGRNNSGKTSLTELFRRLFSDSPVFRLEDFSLSAHDDFWKAFVLKSQKADEKAIRDGLPRIEIKITIEYEKDSADFGPLGAFVIDLNRDSTKALILIQYELKAGEIESFFEGFVFDSNIPEAKQKTDFCRGIKERVPEHYVMKVFAVDPNDPTNFKAMEPADLRRVIQNGFINAQRGLDDETLRHKNVLGGILEALFQNASAESADPKDKAVAEKLEAAVESMQKGIEDGFNTQLIELIPAFSLFGYPGLSDPELQTETILDVKRLLTDHTKVHYAGINGVHLPEAYNGLGTRNLIYILLKLLEFFKEFASNKTAPSIHLVFIEEPEVHLHPQMQEVFISSLNRIAEVFTKAMKTDVPWPVQFVVTTHSSHLANKASFDSMRYFITRPETKWTKVRFTEIKDLRKGLGGDAEDLAFLHKYMTLTRCDLLFADRAVLIEGPTERILLPKMIEKSDAKVPTGPQLAAQYVSIVEVGGAYAHRFFNLLAFLELRTLVISDLDTVDRNADGTACKVSAGTHTSNGCLKAWFSDDDITPQVLLRKSAADKTTGPRRLAYEIPEVDGKACGRSFEDAFILANPGLFNITGLSEEEKEAQAYAEAEKVKKKPDFALKYAIEETNWIVPRYIEEGMRWLAEGPDVPASGTVLPTATPVSPTADDAINNNPNV